MKRKLLIIGIILSVVITVCAIPYIMVSVGNLESKYHEVHWYHTDDVADYAVITHNGDNRAVEIFVDSFFPKQIESYFSDVKYDYKARDYCDFCCEISLEFTIEDSDAFYNYVETVTKDLTGTKIAYDEHYCDYLIADELDVDAENLRDDGSYYLENIEMGRILVCEKDQRVIFYAIKLTNCCGTGSDKFDFYKRFAIDPLEYAQSKLI